MKTQRGSKVEKRHRARNYAHNLQNYDAYLPSNPFYIFKLGRVLN
jgi:hypothetical protein